MILYNNNMFINWKFSHLNLI